jgi:single-strand DNA-binding protein
MAGLNRAILIGNLGMDPELRYTQSGTAVLRLRLATTETFMNREREKQERTDWHTIVVWGNRGEALSKILGKGRSIGVEGRIQTRSWDDKEGHKRYTTEIVASNIVLLGSGRGASNETNTGNDSIPPDFTTSETEPAALEDDIPF